MNLFSNGSDPRTGNRHFGSVTEPGSVRSGRRTRKHARKLAASQYPIRKDSSLAALSTSNPLLPGSGWKRTPIQQTSLFFQTVPNELRLEILSYLPLLEIASLRKLCQRFYEIVNECEQKIAGPVIRAEKKRLQEFINSVNTTQMPTDTDSFLASLRIWTGAKGSFKDTAVASQSYERWFSHIAGNAVKTTIPPTDFERWARLATLANRLQEEVLQPVHQPFLNGPLWQDFQRCVCSIDRGSPLNSTELRKLFDRIVATRQYGLSDIKKPFRKAIPNSTRLHAGIPANRRLTPLDLLAPDADHPHGRVKQAKAPNGSILGFLGELPELPPGYTFCYWVKEKWVMDLLEVHYAREKDLTLLKKAVALKHLAIH